MHKLLAAIVIPMSLLMFQGCGGKNVSDFVKEKAVYSGQIVTAKGNVKNVTIFSRNYDGSSGGMNFEITDGQSSISARSFTKHWDIKNGDNVEVTGKFVLDYHFGYWSYPIVLLIDVSETGGQIAGDVKLLNR